MTKRFEIRHMPVDLMEEVVKKYPATNATESAIKAMRESVRTVSVQDDKEVKQSEALPVNLEPITSMLQEVLSLLKEKESPVRTTSVQKEEKEDDFAREVREKILTIQELPPLPSQNPKEEDWEIVEDKGEDW